MLKQFYFVIFIFSIFTLINSIPYGVLLPYRACSQYNCPPKTVMCDSRSEQINNEPEVEIITCKDARGQILETRKETKKPSSMNYYFPHPFYFSRPIFNRPFRFYY
ncbi:hypothetical protein GWI33_014379 [Rhynchophorus ferrugineus]|uniref:Uncharacterized protein n=1 Tax=Rhynchophorus ferrugineus TaxID=354439 RepID=A0A834M952_RHYFE|nr:hypothetical protein GWI33_014379 [Rhynchophorus ferrugineus]